VTEPRRVKVDGNLFHPVVPDGAVYVGRRGPGLRASAFANPFRLKDGFARTHPLRGYLEQGLLNTTSITGDFLERPVHDLLYPVTPAVATAAYRAWLNDRPGLAARARAALAGRDLACWCVLPELGQPDYCHAAVLLAISNGMEVPNA
jgi:hypothetical protein